MLPRVLEPEVMDTELEARDYDAMDHSTVNRVFVDDLLAFAPLQGSVLDVGAGTAQIPIELCWRCPSVSVMAIDLAEHMLQLGRQNVQRAGLNQRIELRRVDAKRLPFADGEFAAVMSNSIVHHIPEPRLVLAEMIRVTKGDGTIFVRDLLRPESDADVRRLVDTYAADANPHQRALFDASLRAALTLEEVRHLVAALGLDPAQVRQTSDRHWTWACRR